MQALLAPLRELAEYGSIKEMLRKRLRAADVPPGLAGSQPGPGGASGWTSSVVSLTGCVDSQKLHMIYGLSEGVRTKVIITYSDLKAREIL